jgi:hypothetical protein
MRSSNQSRDREEAPSDAVARLTPQDASNRTDSRVERLALLILLALIPLRAVLSETHSFEVARSLRNLDAPGAASPATTFALCAVIFGVATLVAFARLWTGGPRYRRSGAEWGALLLIIGMAISTWRAGQKHLAIIGSLDFLALLVYFVTLSQLLRRPWQVRLALTVILAAGGIMLAKCAYQHWVEWPETVKYYQEHKAELLASNQSSPGFIYDYEQRLKSGSLSGYFNHPNVLASYLILVIFAALAVVRARWMCRPGWTVAPPALIAAVGFVALIGAQSKGAVAALAIGLMFWLAAWVLREKLLRAPVRAVATVWLLLFMGSVALAATLHYKPGALGLSMLYRSFYWRASAAMVADQGPWGVGANNFGRFFTRYKDVACPEDVEDPHSWPVRALTEWGVLGLAGMLVVFIGVSLRIARRSFGPLTSSAEEPEAQSPRHLPGAFATRNESSASLAGDKSASIILWAAAISLIFTLGWFATLYDAAPAFLLLTLVMPLWVWFVTFFATGYEPADGMRFVDRAPGPIITPICAGLVAFLIHSGIDLAMFQGGPATTFFALLAIALAAHALPLHGPLVRESLLAPSPAGIPSGDSLIRLAAVLVEIGGLVAIAATFSELWLPSAACSGFLNKARKAIGPRDLRAYQVSGPGVDYINAADFYALDSTAVEERIDQLTQRASNVDQVDEVLRLVDELERRDPHSALIPHHRATLYYQRFELSRRFDQSRARKEAGGTVREGAHDERSPLPHGRGSDYLADLNKSIEYMRQSVAAHPTNPTRHLFLADLLEKRAGVEEDAGARKRLLAQSADELQTALDVDAKRIYVSPLHRLSDESCKRIRERVTALGH